MKRKQSPKGVKEARLGRRAKAPAPEEDIRSEESGPEVGEEVSYHGEEVDVNERRLALARKVIEDARVQLGQTKRVKGAEPEEGSDDEAEHLAGEAHVSDYLQAKLAAARRSKFVPHFAEIEDWFQKKGRKFDHLVLKAHKRPITACCFNPATTDLISVGKDGAIVLFDFASGFKRRLLNPGAPKDASGHKGELLCLDVSDDGRFLATAGKDRAIKIWDLGMYSKDLQTMKKNIAKGDFAIKGKHSSVIIAHRKLSSEGLGLPENGHAQGHTNGKGTPQESLARLRETSQVVPGHGHPFVERHPQLVLVQTLEGHRDWVTAVKFKHGTHELISVSVDRSLKLWDASKGALLETLYGHRSDVLGLDLLGSNAVSVGFDKLPIMFKLDRETQMVFDQQLFSLDCVKAINQHFFVTGSQDGSLSLWNVGKRRPLVTAQPYAERGWTSAIGGQYNTDFFVTGAVDAPIKLWKVAAGDLKNWAMEERLEIPSEGVVTCLAVSEGCEFLAVVEGPENRLGRWTPHEKVKSRVKVFKIKRHE